MESFQVILTIVLLLISMIFLMILVYCNLLTQFIYSVYLFFYTYVTDDRLIHLPRFVYILHRLLQKCKCNNCSKSNSIILTKDAGRRHD